MKTIKIIKPDDWHVHFREGIFLRKLVFETSKIYQRAIVMPNLSTPITNSKLAKTYKSEVSSGVRNQFEANRNPSVTGSTGDMDPTGNAGDLNMVNSNNRTVTTNNNAGVVLDTSGAIDRKDNLSNQIKNPSNLF